MPYLRERERERERERGLRFQSCGTRRVRGVGRECALIPLSAVDLFVPTSQPTFVDQARVVLDTEHCIKNVGV
jgi:hypothetical protein